MENDITLEDLEIELLNCSLASVEMNDTWAILKIIRNYWPNEFPNSKYLIMITF